MSTKKRAIRTDLVDALVLEVHGLVHDQGWLADRALERALRRERTLYSAERRAIAEALYGIVRWQGQLDLLLGGRPSLALRYAAWLARFGLARRLLRSDDDGRGRFAAGKILSMAAAAILKAHKVLSVFCR